MDERSGGEPAEPGTEPAVPSVARDTGPGRAPSSDTGVGPDAPPGDPGAEPADPADDIGDEGGGRDPRRFNDWRKRSATGAVMTGIALGLREALELPRERPALVIEAPGEPGDPDHPIDLRFDPDSPEATVAIVRQPDEGGTTGRSAGS